MVWRWPRTPCWSPDGGRDPVDEWLQEMGEGSEGHQVSGDVLLLSVWLRVDPRRRGGSLVDTRRGGLDRVHAGRGGLDSGLGLNWVHAGRGRAR